MNKVVVYVEGGNVQGARSNNPDIDLQVFDVDNLKGAEAPISSEEIEAAWKEFEKEYPHPIF